METYTTLPTRTRTPEFWESFWVRVDRRAPSECWPWRGWALTKKTYPRFRVEACHRLVVEFVLGRPMRADFWALHACDNPPCCNPTHLSEGTASANSTQRWERDLQGHNRGAHRGPHGFERAIEFLNDPMTQSIADKIKWNEPHRASRQWGTRLSADSAGHAARLAAHAARIGAVKGWRVHDVAEPCDLLDPLPGVVLSMEDCRAIVALPSWQARRRKRISDKIAVLKHLTRIAEADLAAANANAI